MFRRLAKIRSRLLTDARRELAARIAVSQSEIDSIIRAMGNDVELTLERILGQDAAQRKRAARGSSKRAR
jgi:hypothetical protein